MLKSGIRNIMAVRQAGVCIVFGGLFLIAARPVWSEDKAEPSPSKPQPCAAADKRVELPAEFPKNIPVLPGTVFTSSRQAGNSLLVQGLVPMELSGAVRFFLQKFPAAGFQVGRGEAEVGEADAPFRGNGLMGGFKLRTARDCPGWLELVISVQPMPNVNGPNGAVK
jgi:hypothetical protein